MVVLTLKAKHDHLEKVATTRDPIKAVSEFVWNALDADATTVSVDLRRNRLGGLEAIVIRDNGTGISKPRADHDFESLGESWKLRTNRTEPPRVCRRRCGLSHATSFCSLIMA
jgi:hypothetical protein